jgi:PAS domain S-box-containing protein
MDDSRIKPASNAVTAGRALLIFLPLITLAALVAFFFYRAQLAGERNLLRTEQEKSVDLIAYALISAFSPARSDLLVLARQSSLQHWLAQPDPERRSQLEHDFVVFAEAKGVYDQVRIIDGRGREAVRVNYSGGRAQAIPENALQDKSARPFVRQARDLADGEVYVTGLSLNIELGIVEQPMKPVIRFITPVAGGEGAGRAIVVLNYLGKPLLEAFREVSQGTTGEYWLVDEQGQWVIGPRQDGGVRFHLGKQRVASFASLYPEAWAVISADPTSGLVDGEESYAYKWLDPNHRLGPVILHGPSTSADAPTAWAVVGQLTSAAVASAAATHRYASALVLAGFALLLAYPAWALARSSLIRQQTEKALRSSESIFRGLIESAPDAVVIVDARGCIRLINSQGEHLFGYSRVELIGQPVEILIPLEFRADHEKHRARYQSKPTTRPMGSGLDIRGRRKDGTEMALELSLSPRQDGAQPGAMAIVRDVTVQRASEREIRRLNRDLHAHAKELEAINGELEAFSYSVSHDLRAPLRAIDGFSQALLEDYGEHLDSAGKDYLQRVRNGAQSMSLLIDDLLKLSRVTRSELRIAEVDLANLAREVVEELREAEPERDVAVEIEDILQVHGDTALLRVALQNLLNNAWKFTACTEPARIQVGRSSLDGDSVVFVRDNGVGFDMAYSSKLFGAFQRLHPQREFPGTGIGLATVQRVIHKHGGRVWAESEVNHGASFYFTLGERAGP